MPLCPQVTITPVTVTSSNMTVTSVIAGGVSSTVEQLAEVDADAQQALADAAAALAAAQAAQTDATAALSDAAAAQADATAALADAASAQADATTAIANAATAQSTATAAQATASSAYDTAVTANTTANTAQATANGKNKVTYSTSTPGTTANTAGDIWFQYGTSGPNAGRIIAQYTGNGGTSWTQTTVSGLVIANIDAGSITTGTLSVGIGITGTNGSFTLNAVTGVLTATGVNVTGTITATTGTFTGTVIATTGTFTGTVFATTGTFTGTVTATTGTFTGTVIANTGTFTGTVIATTGTFTGTVIANTGSFTGTVIATTGSFTGTVITPSATITGGSLVLGTGNVTTSINSSGTINIVDSSTGLLSSPGISLTSNGAGTRAYMGSAGLYFGSTSQQIMAIDGLNELGGYSGVPRIYAPAATYIRIVPDAGLARTAYPVYIEGNVEINHRLQVFGNINAPNIPNTTSTANVRWTTGGTGQFQYNNASSARIKENITDIGDIPGLDPKALLDIPVRAFSYKSSYLSESDDRYGVMVPGFIAEEVDAIYPIAVDYEVDGPVTWNERFIIPAMLSLIQDLYKEINTLKGGN